MQQDSQAGIVDCGKRCEANAVPSHYQLHIAQTVELNIELKMEQSVANGTASRKKKQRDDLWSIIDQLFC